MRDIRSALSIAVAIFPLFGCATDQSADGKLATVMPKPLEMAADAERRGDWEGAAHHWAQLVEAQPADRTARLALARALRLSGSCGPATGAIAPLLTATANDADALIESAKCHLVSARPEGAETQLHAAIAAAPESWEAETTLAVTLDRQGRHAEAQLHHDRALELVPDKAIVISNKALSLAMAGMLPDSLRLMRKAAALPGAPSRVRMNLAMLEALSGKGDRAETIASQEQLDSKTEKLQILKRIAEAASDTPVKKP